MKYSKNKMYDAISNNGIEDKNKNIALIKKNIEKIHNLKIKEEYPNGNKYTILILSRATNINDNIAIFKECYNVDF